MSVTISGTNGIDKVAANSVESGDIQAGAVSQTNLASGLAGNGPAFSAYLSADQTGISANTWTKINLNAEVFDTNGNFASSKFTPTVAGFYQIDANIGGQTTGDMFCVIYKNGAANKIGSYTVNGNGAMSHVSGLIDMNGSTDYIELYFYTGGSTAYGGANQTYMTGCLVRAA